MKLNRGRLLPTTAGSNSTRHATGFETTRLNLPEAARNQIFKEIIDEMLGFGPLQPLLDDPTVSEVMVNGPNMVYIEKNGNCSRRMYVLKMMMPF